MSAPGTEVARRQEQAVGTRSPLGLHNGVIAPDRWAMFGRMAHVMANTDFAPKGMKGKPDAIMAALLYGDSLDLHPSVSLSDIFIVDGKPGISGALMLAKIRTGGHKVWFEEIRDEQGRYLGSRCIGQRLVAKTVNRRKVMEVEEQDEWSYTLEDATRAGLIKEGMDKRAAWYKTPEVMCRWRALAQLARFLFPDVFRGQAVYTPDEAQEAAYAEQAAVNGSREATPPEETDDIEIEWGAEDEPDLAMWLIELVDAANQTVEGSHRPRKVQAMLAGLNTTERRQVAEDLEKFIVRNGGEVPTGALDSTEADPEEEIEEAEFTAAGEDDEVPFA